MGDLITCHQCRQRKRSYYASCKSTRRGKPCPLKFCFRCLSNRYELNAEDTERENNWKCPKCKDECNCSCCRRRKGLQPTGKQRKIAKAEDSSSTSIVHDGRVCYFYPHSYPIRCYFCWCPFFKKQRAMDVDGEDEVVN